jgi:hypothetical protein
MNTDELIRLLIDERNRIDKAIKLLSDSSSTAPTKATKPAKNAVTLTHKRKKGTMSAAGRKRVADAQRKRWAAAKKAAKTVKNAVKAPEKQSPAQ